MAFTTPITWESQLVTVNQFNEQIRDNMRALKDPPGGVSYVSARNYALDASGSWQPVDTGLVVGNLLRQVTVTDNSTVVARVMGQLVLGNNAAQIGFGISVGGVQYFPASGLGVIRGGAVTNISATVFPVNLTFILTAQSAGTNAYRLDWFGTHTVTTLLSTTGYYTMFSVREMPS